jgi:hypothetical protein
MLYAYNNNNRRFFPRGCMVCLVPTTTGNTAATTAAVDTSAALFGIVAARDCDKLAPSADKLASGVQCTIGIAFEGSVEAAVKLLCGESGAVQRDLVMVSTNYFAYRYIVITHHVDCLVAVRQVHAFYCSASSMAIHAIATTLVLYYLLLRGQQCR